MTSTERNRGCIAKHCAQDSAAQKPATRPCLPEGAKASRAQPPSTPTPDDNPQGGDNRRRTHPPRRRAPKGRKREGAAHMALSWPPAPTPQQTRSRHSRQDLTVCSCRSESGREDAPACVASPYESGAGRLEASKRPRGHSQESAKRHRDVTRPATMARQHQEKPLRRSYRHMHMGNQHVYSHPLQPTPPASQASGDRLPPSPCASA